MPNDFVTAILVSSRIEVFFVVLWIISVSFYLFALATGYYKSRKSNTRFSFSFAIILYTIGMMVYATQVNKIIGGTAFLFAGTVAISVILAKLIS